MGKSVMTSPTALVYVIVDYVSARMRKAADEPFLDIVEFS